MNRDDLIETMNKECQAVYWADRRGDTVGVKKHASLAREYADKIKLLPPYTLPDPPRKPGL